jgi:flagellar basal-body rod protein FlgB
MTDLTVAVAAKALDGLLQRQTAISSNIANAGSNDYRPLSVSFETELATAARSEGGSISAVATVRPLTRVDPYQMENRIDLQIAASSETSMRYEMLTEMLGRSLQLQAAALNPSGGK